METLTYESDFTTGAIIGIIAFGLLFVIAFYVLNAIAVSTIAKKNGYDKHWLAWIPIANAFVLPILVNNYVHPKLRGNYVTFFTIIYVLSIIFSDSLGFSIILMVVTYYTFYIVAKWYSHNHVAHLVISIFTLGLSMPISLLRFRNREKLTSEFEEKTSDYI